jgi:hypothetical protein
MRLVSATADWLSKYQELAKDRKLGYEPWPSRLAVMVAEGQDLVAGVMVYDSSGMFLFFEHLLTNETASLRQRYEAVDLLVGECIHMCRIFGKIPQVVVRHNGIKRILEKHGLFGYSAQVMTCSFGNLEKHEKPFAARKHSRRRKDSAPTERAPAGDAEEHLGVYASVLGGAGG